MKRAPWVKVNEKTFRRTKRAQFVNAVKAIRTLRHAASLTPAGREIAEAEVALRKAYAKLKPWWFNR